MSGNPVASSPATAGAGDPSAGQRNYGFSARVLLMAALLLVALTVVFTLIRVLLRRGLDESALSALPITAYRKGSGSTGGAGADCAVCLSEFADGEKVRELPNCGHGFHMEFADAWLRTRTTCPLCRAEAELPQGNGKAEAASSSATEPPALFGAGGTLIVTVHGVSESQRDVPVSGPCHLDRHRGGTE
ncbi:hypothetical protein ACQ4PT_014354 [Festuca glaucescens]